MRKKNAERYIYLDILNIVACIFVIFLHCNGIVHTFSDTKVWRESMVVETVAYCAVPIFFMISGATLIPYREKYSTKVFMKKRIVKTVIPFVIWTFISLGFKMMLGMITFKWTFPDIINLFVNTTAENVYWFFIPLFMIYLSMPVLSLINKNLKILIYIFVVSFVLYSVYPVACLCLHIPKNGSIIMPVAGGYLMLAIMGYILSTVRLQRKIRWVIYGLGIFGLVVRYTTTVVWSVKSGMLNETFWGYQNFPSVFWAAAVFVMIKYMPWEKIFFKDRTKKMISKIASLSFGVYLMHMIIYRTLALLTGIENSTYVWRFVMPWVIYGICALLTFLLKKIPVLKYIVP